MRWPETEPDYAGRWLGNILPAIGAHLAVPGCTDDLIGLPSANRWVVLLVDGLGWELLLRSLGDAPTLAEWLPDAAPLTCGVPSTTAASLSSLGTGLTPGQHGLVGYRFWAKDLAAYFSPLSWDTATPPQVLQPQPTLLERAAAAHVATSVIVPSSLAGSAFSAAVLRGSVAIGVDEFDAEQWIAAVVEATSAPAALVYAYDRTLDHTGHGRGVASAVWRSALTRLDTTVAALRAALPDDVVLLVTGDHGMVDVPQDRRLTVEATADLMADVDHIAGEARFRHLYTAHPTAVVARWADRVGESAWVLTRVEAIERGWFGPVTKVARGRIGDVVAVVRDDSAILTRRMPYEARLVGMHGALTKAEMLVPLFVVAG